jgi:hypothetical protein
MALFDKSVPVFWELIQLEGTANWRCYVRSACTISAPVVLLVQFVPNVNLNEEAEGEGQSSHHGGEEEMGGEEEEGGQEEDDGAEEEQEADEAIGVVDGGEEDREVLRQYNGEIDDYERALEDDSLDDEDESIIPSDWESYDFSQLTVNPGVNVTWEYQENELSEAALYANLGELKDAMKRLSTLTLNRECKVLKSSLTVYDVRCVKPDYPFRVHAYKGKWKDYWKISIVVDHTCALDQLDASNRNLTVGFIAGHMYSQIV